MGLGGGCAPPIVKIIYFFGGGGGGPGHLEPPLGTPLIIVLSVGPRNLPVEFVSPNSSTDMLACLLSRASHNILIHSVLRPSTAKQHLVSLALVVLV